MTQMLTQQLNALFQKAAVSHALKGLSSVRDLEELADISIRADDRRKELTARYVEEYDTRVEIARQQLSSKSAQVTRNYPARPGASIVDSDTMIWMAHQLVRLAHEADLKSTTDDYVREMEDLLERALRDRRLRQA